MELGICGWLVSYVILYFNGVYYRFVVFEFLYLLSDRTSSLLFSAFNPSVVSFVLSVHLCTLFPASIQSL